MTPYSLLQAYPDRTRPLVTYYGGPDVRVELSVATTLNGVAKAASMLRDGLGVAPGSVVSVDLPRHWQLPVWVMAALSVGAQVGRDLDGDVAVRIVGPHALVDPAAADDILASSCDAFGLPIPGGVPAGIVDLATEVRGYPDTFTAYPGDEAKAALFRAGTPRPWAARWTDLPDAARIWVDETTPPGDLLELTAVQPLLVRGSVVIGTQLTAEDAQSVRATESASIVEAA